MASRFLVLASVLFLIGHSLANPTGGTTDESVAVATTQQNVVTPVPQTSSDNYKVVGPCSSYPYEPNPCGMTKIQGMFSWVKDTRSYEWIYMSFYLTSGCCIFIFVISAALYQRKTSKKKRPAQAQQTRNAEEPIRSESVYGSPRRGSHIIAQPRRDSLSVRVEDPAQTELVATRK